MLNIVNRISPTYLTDLFETYHQLQLLTLGLVLVRMNICLYSIPMAMLIHKRVFLPK